MNLQIRKSAPEPRKAFAQNLEQRLLAHGTWEARPSRLARYSFVSVTFLVLLALATGLLYPLTQPKDYVALAKEFYDSYETEGILYQRTERFMMHPKGGEMSINYTLETWFYQGYNLMLTSNERGDLHEGLPGNILDIDDESGNHFSYGDPSEYATLQNPPTEAPYCVLTFKEETEELLRYDMHAFEVSPSALEAFNTIYLTDKPTYSFDQDGKLRDYLYASDSGYSKEKNTAPPEEINKELELYSAINAASASPEQAKLLFELLSEGYAYSQESREDENGAIQEVIRLAPVPYNEEYSDAVYIQEFVFGDHYQLLESNSYKDAQLMEQIKYVETKVLPLEEKDTIFDANRYGLKLVNFEHTLPWWDGIENISEGLQCYSFQNEMLSQGETNELAEEYAPMIENITKYADLTW